MLIKIHEETAQRAMELKKNLELSPEYAFIKSMDKKSYFSWLLEQFLPTLEDKIEMCKNEEKVAMVEAGVKPKEPSV